ncbi:YdiU family protein [Roseomonas sp. CCTCC AB2023176]|uniref:protein adenylyltransferase SelO n=1 Tax=Roseomonas sp. CCTCC AB2023176 TaxID=3342640 RepID=UPI0035D8F62B
MDLPDPALGTPTLDRDAVRRVSLGITFDNTYARLPERFFARLPATPVAAPRLVRVNRPLAELLGIDADALESPGGVAALAGNAVPEGADPIAQAYAGHQFGGFTPQLGDGRAILLGEVVARDGTRRDIQLKGSGPTPFSRRGDGRAAIGPVLREFIISEAMYAMGVPTTRSLAAVRTGERVLRETVLPGAVLTRIAASHIRVGTFQYFAARQDVDALSILADYAIARHDPEAAHAERPYEAFLAGVVARQAALVARWLHLGFVHGVMNTDNTTVSGETIDYGPCAFLEAYDAGAVFSSIDYQGRYAYGNQPGIVQWNLARLAECLLPLFSDRQEDAMERAKAALSGFAPIFTEAYAAGLRAKIGLATARDGDDALVEDLLRRMADGEADFTLTFRRLCDAAADPAADAAVRILFSDPAAYDEWAPRWRARLAEEPVDGVTRRHAMRRVNPLVIPRNHLVEEALAAAARNDDGPFERLLAEVTRPYEERDAGRYAIPAKPAERVTQTFCGT